ncbi:hypothetical protein KY342_00200 [Candidatus Woesearchaeota archaeon]|nr:hypothetical protein [Candidatus Woesearchaeota archaeon]
MRDIVIKGEHIVHGIYITVIVILAIALIFKSSDSCSPSLDETEDKEIEEKEDDTTIQMVKNASITIIKNTNPKSSSVTIPTTTTSTTTTPSSQTNTSQNETTTEEDEEEPEEGLLLITGQVEIDIDRITTEKKGENWAKVVKIKYTIKNQKTNFYPRILVYLWDDNDDADIRNYVEEEIYLSKLKAGEALTEEKDVSISYNEINKEKTLKLVLEDEDGYVLDAAIKKFTT